MSQLTVVRGPEVPPTFRSDGLIPVIGYVRVSTWREEKISDDVQMTVIEEAARRRGRRIARWIIDLDKTGRNFKRRVMEAIEAVERGEVSEIWVWKFSRFGRSRHGVAINLYRVESVGGELVSATEDVDAKTAVGEFTRDMLFAVASFESNRAGEQWKETHELRRNMGLPATGGKRFGYKWFPRRLPDGEGGWTLQEERYEVLPDQAEAALDAYRMYAQGRTGFGKLAALWNDYGFVNTRGARWQDQTVRWYLDSGFAAGVLRVHRRDVRCGEPARCQNREHYTYVAAEHEGIITGDEWDAYRERRETRRQTPRRALAPVYPLAGLVRCGLCVGAAMIHMSKGIPGYAYRCGPRARQKVRHEAVWIRRVLVEDEVLEWLRDVQREIDAIVSGAVARPEAKRTPGLEQRRKRLEMDIAKLTAALDRATEGNIMGRIPDDTYERTRDKLVGERDKLQRELDGLAKDDEQQERGPHLHQEVVEGLLAEWNTIDVHTKRTLLSTLIRRVEIYPEDRVRVVPVWAPEDKAQVGSTGH